MNALNLLKHDHASVKALISRFDSSRKTDVDTRIDLFSQIRRELQVHSRVEEEIFYPALKALNGEGRSIVSNAIKEHAEMDHLLIRISRFNRMDQNFDEAFEALVESLNHHVEEEEGEIFRFAEENFSEQQLEDIGWQIEDRKRSLGRQMAA
jgi:hemerythrin superfamily protein